MPVYNYMDAYPHQKNQMPFVEYYPNFGGNPPHMMPCNGCCYHGNFPGYHSFRPPVYQFSPSPQYQCHGYRPIFSKPYPTHYPPAPYHFPMEQPSFEYDKDEHQNYHCCGCPNHPHNQKHGTGVKIEEEPEVVKQSNSLVPVQLKNLPYPIWVPSEYLKKNDEQKSAFESGEAEQERAQRNKEFNEDSKPSDRDPRAWSGWFPLDMKSLKPLMEEEDAKKEVNQQNENKRSQFQYPFSWMPPVNKKDDAKEEKKVMDGWLPLSSLMQGEDDEKGKSRQNDGEIRQFPYPIVWIPSGDKQEEIGGNEQKGTSAFPASVEEPRFGYKLFPPKYPEMDSMVSESEKHGDSGGQVKSFQLMDNAANQSTPMMNMNSIRNEGNKVEDKEKKVKHIPVRSAETSASTGQRKKSPSSPKASKLPPVCLRVERLAKKKNSNGNSRSPGPPGIERQTENTMKDTSLKPSVSSGSEDNAKLDTQIQSMSMSLDKREEKEPETQTIDMDHGKDFGRKNGDLGKCDVKNIPVLHVDSREEDDQNITIETSGKDGVECTTEVAKGSRAMGEISEEVVNKTKRESGSTDGKCSVKTVKLSDAEAAKLIQSAYRGYEVRKYDPLEKLKLMAKVREQIAEIRSCIEALKSADVKATDKQIVTVGEMVMNLLLKLDTIQGLHPSQRDVRKALARELVGMQEELDSLKMKLKGAPEQVSISNPTVDISNHANGITNLQEGVILENALESTGNGNAEMKERDCEMQLSQNLSCDNQGQEMAKPHLVDKQDDRGFGVEVEKSVQPSVEESSIVDLAPKMDLEKTPCSVGDDADVAKTKKGEGSGEANYKQLVHQSLVLQQESDTQDFVESQLQDSSCDPKGHDEGEVAEKNSVLDADDRQEAKEFIRLPVEEIDKEPFVSKVNNEELVHKAVVNEEVESGMSLEQGSPPINEKLESKMPLEQGYPAEVSESNLLDELSVGVVEDDLVDSLPEQIGTLRLNDDTPTQFGLKQQHHVAEADDVIKVMVQELPGYEAVKTEEIQPRTREKIKDEVREEIRDGACISEENDGKTIVESQGMSILTQDSGEPDEEQRQDAYQDKKEVINQKQLEETECIMENGEMEEQPSGSKITEEDVLVTTPTSEGPRDADEMMIEKGNKLVEENVRLREMMEQLMEAGKKQLNVISSLTGKVKDLERKLSRKKKLGTKRYRKPATANSRLKSPNAAMGVRVIDAAL